MKNKDRHAKVLSDRVIQRLKEISQQRIENENEKAAILKEMKEALKRESEHGNSEKVEKQKEIS